MCKWLTNGVTNDLLINWDDPPSMKPFLQGGCFWRGEKCQHSRPTKTVHCYTYDSIEILTRNHHPHHKTKLYLANNPLKAKKNSHLNSSEVMTSIANLQCKYLGGSVSNAKILVRGRPRLKGASKNIQHVGNEDRLVT